jgi:hypothetical protein
MLHFQPCWMFRIGGRDSKNEGNFVGSLIFTAPVVSAMSQPPLPAFLYHSQYMEYLDAYEYFSMHLHS